MEIFFYIWPFCINNAIKNIVMNGTVRFYSVIAKNAFLFGPIRSTALFDLKFWPLTENCTRITFSSSKQY